MKFSVIIPTYNIEKYISSTLDSVLKQSGSFEIICLDDNSTDNTVTILNQYAKKYDCIKVIQHNKNYGPGYLRNKGMKMARGDFIMFLDSDDWYEPSLFKKLIGIISKFPDVNIIEFRFNISKTETSKKTAWWLDLGKQGIKQTTLDNIMLSTGAWNKCWKREFLQQNNLSFCENNRSGEEIPLHICAFLLSKNFFYLDFVGYNWRYLETSLSHDKRKDSQFLDGVWLMLDFLKTELIRLHLYEETIYTRFCGIILKWHINEKFSFSRFFFNYYKKVNAFLKASGQKTLEPYPLFLLKKIFVYPRRT